MTVRVSAAFIALFTLQASGAWRYWVGDDSVLGGDGTWSATALSWSQHNGGGQGAYATEEGDNIQFGGESGGAVTVDGEVQWSGQIYMMADGYKLEGGTIWATSGLAWTLYPGTLTTVKSSVKARQPSGAAINMSINMPNANDYWDDYLRSVLVIDSDLTQANFDGRIILYRGTLVINGDLGTSSTVGTYSTSTDFIAKLVMNGTHTGSAGYSFGPNGTLAGNGSIIFPNENAEAKIYGTLAPGGIDSPGTLTVSKGKVRIYEGAKMSFRVDLAAGKADKLVVDDGGWMICDTDAGAAVEINISGRTGGTCTFDLYDCPEGRKKNSFTYVVNGAEASKVKATFDESTGVLTVSPLSHPFVILVR